MFGSQIIDIAIAMILFYLFISLICSAVREFIESIMKTRAMNIERGIRELLDDPDGSTITKALFDHPQLAGLFQGSYNPGDLKKGFAGLGAKLTSNLNMARKGRKNLPSYIPASNFAIALLDVTAKRAAGDRSDPAPPPGPLTLDAVRGSISALPNSQVQRAVLDAVDRANGDLLQAQKNLEDWFNSTMDRVSGWYKRRTQFILFALGLGAAIFLNLDTFTQLHIVSTDKALRDELVGIAAKTDAKDPNALQTISNKFQSAGVKMGWGDCTVSSWDCVPRPMPQAPGCQDGRCASWPSFWDTMRMILGWLITGLAVTLGAPFWFDTLSKFMSVRSALKPDDKPAATPAPASGATAAAAPPPTPPPPPFTPNGWAAGYAYAGDL